MKTCTKCKLEKELDNFYLDKRRNKHYSMCRVCYLENYKQTRKRYHKEYYKENKQSIIDNVSKWRKENHEKFRDTDNKRWRTIEFKNNLNYIFSVIKQNSKRKNRELLITKESFINWYNKQEQVCFYCGIDKETITKCGFSRLQIDRVDNDVPYKEDNIVLSCHLCNKTKSNILNRDEMIFIGTNIIKNIWKRMLQSL